MTALARIEALPFWKSRPALTLIEGGRTNRNYMAQDGSSLYFVRCGEDIAHLGISRTAERRAAELAAAAGLAPQIRYAADGILISDFISGTALDPVTASEPQMLGAIARQLRVLHRIPATPGLPLFCPVTISLSYLGRLDDACLPIARERLRQCLEKLPRAEACCLVHGDLIPENFIHATDGRLQLVDWEYAGNGEPEIDIALIASNFDLSCEQLQEFISAYGGADHRAIAQFRIAAAIREALWCLMQLQHGEMSADLTDYAEKCTDRMARMLK